jgi:hypothetical protein
LTEQWKMNLYTDVDAFRTYEGALYCLQCCKQYDEDKKRSFEMAEMIRREANAPSRVIPYKGGGFCVAPDNQVRDCSARIDSIHDLLTTGKCNIPTLDTPPQSGV